MSNDAAFEQVMRDLSSGNKEGVSVKISEIANGSDDPFELLKCMSLLKVLPDDGTISKIGARLVEITGENKARDVCIGLRSLECPTFAIEILKKMNQSDETFRLRCACLEDLEEYESAMELYSKINRPFKDDRILLSRLQSAVGEHKMAIETSSKLLEEYPEDYDVRICYVSSLILGGKDKDAVKYTRQKLKDKTADSNAVAAYVLRVMGKTKAAGGYATRAVQIDNTHIGGMETLGICLAQQGEYEKARIVAGAINEASPGNRAALNVLSYCEGH